MNKPRKKAATGSWRLQDDRPPTFQGWISTDEGEIRRREWRGRTEIVEVHALDESQRPFGDYRITSSSGSSYTVEVRSLGTHINSCECRDYRTNRLGTCKHIEGVLHRLRGNRAAPPRGRTAKHPESSDRIEIYLDERDGRAVRMTIPAEIERTEFAFVQEAGRYYRRLRRNSRKALDALRDMARARSDCLRVSRRLESWIDARRASDRRQRERARFTAALEAGRRSLDFLKQPLLPYQVEGVLHLAFGERVLLADDMGLGKTVQAIAACTLLRELRGVERVLVVSPASLKSGRSRCQVLRSALDHRVRRRPGARHPAPHFLHALQLRAPAGIEVVILDEAQRIKNWQTKTANAVKKLESKYAFVPPARRSRTDTRSTRSSSSWKACSASTRAGREGQARRLSEWRCSRTRLLGDVAAQGRRRARAGPLSSPADTHQGLYEYYPRGPRRETASHQEFERLQKFLACMRMVCDTPYILGDESRDCPKMEEMERLLPDLLDDPERKIIVFSEWVRMLELVREYAAGAGIEFAWHTGSVPQPRRRAEIVRFRQDPECRLFLSSESGGVGLNLQVADTVVNMDQPWNPARLEQRIARAWRKYQTRPVNVINLVSEYTIEHRMLGLLDAKRVLAEGVLDRRGDLSEIPLPTGRAAFMERLNAVLDARADAAAAAAAEGAARALTAVEQLRDDLVAAHGATLRRVFVRDGDEAVLVVLALPPERIAEEGRRLAESTALNVEVIDPATHESMLRLAEAGLIALPGGELREVYPASGPERSESDGRILRAKALTDRAEHKLKAAVLLVGGGFAEEARVPAVDAARLAVAALAAMRGEPEPGDAESAAEFLLGEEPDGIPGGPPHDAIRALSGDEPQDGEVARIEEFVSRISSMIADMSAPSRGAPG